MTPFVYDLFGEIIVTRADIAAWLVSVPHIDPDSPRAAAYVRGWDVAGKVRAAKALGTFDAITAPRLMAPGSPAWWSRMCWT
jgi:hypothetical protein